RRRVRRCRGTTRTVFRLHLELCRFPLCGGFTSFARRVNRLLVCAHQDLLIVLLSGDCEQIDEKSVAVSRHSEILAQLSTVLSTSDQPLDPERESHEAINIQSSF